MISDDVVDPIRALVWPVCVSRNVRARIAMEGVPGQVWPWLERADTKGPESWQSCAGDRFLGSARCDMLQMLAYLPVTLAG